MVSGSGREWLHKSCARPQVHLETQGMHLVIIMQSQVWGFLDNP